MGKVIGIVSGKGGVGKSIITANLAVALSRLGQRVLAVDADVEMSTLHNYLGIKPGRVSIKDVIDGNATIDQALVEGPENTVVLPMKLSLAEIAKTKIPEIVNTIKPVVDLADIVLLDGPAGLKKMPVAIVEMSDEVIIVTGPDISAIQGGLKLRMVAKAFETDVLGVIINRAPINLGAAVIKKMEEVFEAPVLGVVPQDENAVLGLKPTTPVLISKPYTPFSVAIQGIAAKMVGLKGVSTDYVSKEEFLKEFEEKLAVEKQDSKSFFNLLKSKLGRR